MIPIIISKKIPEEIKNSEDKNLQRLREEFNQRRNQNENHPKTSHGIKHEILNQNISNNNSKKFHSYNKSLSANKYIHNIEKNQINKFEIWKNHPGYLYYKEFMKYNSKYNKKRAFTGKVFNRNYKLEPIIKHKNINNAFQYNEYFSKNIGKNNIKNGKQISYSNRKNQYYPLLGNKIFNKNYFNINKGFQNRTLQANGVIRRDDYFFKVNKEKENHYNKNAKANIVMNNSDKFSHNNIYYNNFISKKSNNKNENLNKRGYFIYNNNSNENNKKIDNNNFEINNNSNLQNKDKESDKIKEGKNDIEENDNFDEEKEKLFYTNQKNFFKVRKDIIEEPEYLEEDNDNNEK